ncbi:MAG: glycosyltransferase [Brasilonema octagenarum HA4186-MV1]|jgi:glycosyltransferase involved in cell wall biosynthesis|uniref:Group 1 glycosyl transferase n=2 Tax=Brasilonema TaxID=383614 RepID=A0A856M9T4_9CYAN|nr:MULTISPECIES: glycosyltransferase family 4 protein [Brasilonema]MBW4627290.1 glycosyltransferase [Brasilonema octagenarum HA4186-MV1]NMF62094.1 group 1 glycosyl transferase [Brasilonema octagenarum UFV-OR1]QDL06521.1 group 1 glycosyl transferase [Brasilonema sennae CENA114]QDL12892.1 group 1 glycosyl transferase [Brasilonema octagenarum UFV-E1]
MKLAYVTRHDATNIKAWSGTVYHMVQTLRQQDAKVDYICCLKQKNVLLFQGKQLAYRAFPKKRYLRDREPFILKHYAKQVASKLSQLNCDIVFSEGTIPISYLDCNQPIAFWTDATFAGMVDFYPQFSNLCQETIQSGHAAERSALERCQLAIYSSEWAAKTAIDNYQIDPAKVKIVPFGANIESEQTLDDIKALIDSRPSNQCNLVFLGVDWYRKGGDVALEVARQLNQSGLSTELSVVGCLPIVDQQLPSYVKVFDFISKSTVEGRKQLDSLLSTAHFLIVPSKAECFGVVFCEANSFGVPCLATNVGGIGTIIKDNVNGKTFSKEASIKEYCDYISNLFVEYSRYKQLALSSFHEYQSRLNWSVAGKSVKMLLAELMY